MAVTTDLRLTLAADLAPLGIAIHPSWPDNLDLPLAFISAPLSQGGYVRGGQTYAGHYVVSYDVVILVAHSDPGAALIELEGLIEQAIIHTADWALTGIDSPAPTTISDNGAEYLATIVHLSKNVQII